MYIAFLPFIIYPDPYTVIHLSFDFGSTMEYPDHGAAGSGSLPDIESGCSHFIRCLVSVIIRK
jgi:hypothetical protein